MAGVQNLDRMSGFRRAMPFTFGCMIVGHAHPEVVETVREQAAKGTTFFTSNPAGIRLAVRRGRNPNFVWGVMKR